VTTASACFAPGDIVPRIGSERKEVGNKREERERELVSSWFVRDLFWCELRARGSPTEIPGKIRPYLRHNKQQLHSSCRHADIFVVPSSNGVACTSNSWKSRVAAKRFHELADHVNKLGRLIFFRCAREREKRVTSYRSSPIPPIISTEFGKNISSWSISTDFYQFTLTIHFAFENWWEIRDAYLLVEIGRVDLQRT